jgi:hypothetical protein
MPARLLTKSAPPKETKPAKTYLGLEAPADPIKEVCAALNKENPRYGPYFL